MPVRIDYNNDGLELLGKMLLWGLAIFFSIGLALPWVLNSQIKYFSKGFTLIEE